MDAKKLELILLIVSMALDSVYKLIMAFRQKAEALTLEELEALRDRTRGRTDSLLEEINDLVNAEG